MPEGARTGQATRWSESVDPEGARRLDEVRRRTYPSARALPRRRVRREESGVSFTELPRLSTHEVGEVLARVVARIVKHLCRRGLLDALEGTGDADGNDESDGLTALAASAASGRSPPAGPEWRRKATPLSPLAAAALRYSKPLCASQDGFTSTPPPAQAPWTPSARGPLQVCPPATIAQERVTHGPDGLVRITLKRPFADGTVAVDMDPLSLLSRLATAVPPPRRHTVRYAGSSHLRAR